MSISMPSWYLSNLHLDDFQREWIWSSYSEERQQEIVDQGEYKSEYTALSSASGPKFTSRGEDLRAQYATDAQLSQAVSRTAASGFNGVILDKGSMTSAIFVAIKELQSPTQTDLDEDGSAFNARVADAYNSVAGLFGGSGSQGLLGYDVNGNGYLDNEGELFGFTDGLDKTDYFDLGVADERVRATHATTGETIETDRFMILTSSADSVSVTQAYSKAAGYGGYTTTASSSLNLLDPNRTGALTAAELTVTVDAYA